jgi:hypothetical protein
MNYLNLAARVSALVRMVLSEGMFKALVTWQPEDGCATGSRPPEGA